MSYFGKDTGSGIRVNEIRFVAEDAAFSEARMAAQLTAKTLGTDTESVNEWFRNPEKMIQTDPQDFLVQFSAHLRHLQTIFADKRAFAPKNSLRTIHQGRPPMPQLAQRPRSRRFPFVAAVEITDLKWELRVQQQTTNISLAGCHVAIENPWPIGTEIRIRIVHNGAIFQCLAAVAYVRPNGGMGVAFTKIEPHDLYLLDDWIAALRDQHGFSMVELVVAMAIMLIMAAFATPSILSMMHTARLQGSATDFTGLIQQARSRSVQDDRSYSLYVNPAAGATLSTAFVDLKQNGAIAAGDPEMLLPTEVALVAAANAPSTANLKTQLLPAASPVVPQDAASAAATPITFSPRGLPCTPVAAVCSGAGLSPTAYWAFFKDSQTTLWEAVTISPAGRIQKWSYAASATAWNKM